MAEPNPPPLSDEELQQIKYESFIDQVRRIIGSDQPAGFPKPGWQKFLESSGGTALITVLLGGLMGGVITGLFQYLSKERERGLLVYQQSIEKRQEAIKNIYELIGSSTVSADNLIRLKTSPGTDPKQYNQKIAEEKKSLDLLLEKRKSVIENYEHAEQKWNAERKKPLLLIILYYDNDKDLIEAWTKVDLSITQFFEYSSACFSFGKCDESQAKRKEVDDNVEIFLTRASMASKKTE